MFYDVYSRLCEENHEDEYAVPLKVGYKSNSVVAQWASGSIPRGKYLKALAEHFNVSVAYLLDIKEKPSTTESEGLSKDDIKILKAFWEAPDYKRKAVMDLLGLK